MRVHVVRYERETLVWLAGTLHFHTVGEVRERLWALLVEGVRDIVVDARDLMAMDRGVPATITIVP
jgi:hypothetical protein